MEGHIAIISLRQFLVSANLYTTTKKARIIPWPTARYTTTIPLEYSLDGSSYRPPPRRSIGSPARRSPPPSLLDTPVPSSLSPSSLDILLSNDEDTSQFSQSTASSTLGNYHPPPPRPVPAPPHCPSGVPSSSSETGGITTLTLTRETRLALANPPPQASPQFPQPPPPRQGISQLSPSFQPTLHARYRSTSPSPPQHIPWTIPHQKPPHEILDPLRPAVLPLITALVDSHRSDVIP